MGIASKAPRPRPAVGARGAGPLAACAWLTAAALLLAVAPARGAQPWADALRCRKGAVQGYAKKDVATCRCPDFPPDNWWNVDVSNRAEWPPHPRSAAILSRIQSGPGNVNTALHPDFGGGATRRLGGKTHRMYYGIPFIRWDSRGLAASFKKMKFGYREGWDLGESDPGGACFTSQRKPFMYPIPPCAPVENTPFTKNKCRSRAACDGDRHIIVVDEWDCSLYEVYNTKFGSLTAATMGAVFDLTSNKLRPIARTSADAAGLSIYAGLIKYEETVVKKAINHAIRVTFGTTQVGYDPMAGATHQATDNTDSSLPWMGMRLRLLPGFDCSNGGTIQNGTVAFVVCAAMKKYGLIVADNGSPWYIGGQATCQWGWQDDSIGIHAQVQQIKDYKINVADWEVLAVQRYPADLLDGPAADNYCRCSDFDCNNSECVRPDGVGCTCGEGGWGGATFKACTPQESSCGDAGYTPAGTTGYNPPASIFQDGAKCTNDATLASVCSSPPFASC